MLKDVGEMVTISVDSALASGAVAELPLKKFGYPEAVGGGLQVVPVNGIANLAVALALSSGTWIMKGSATGNVSSGASGTYYLQVAPKGGTMVLVKKS